MKYIRKQTQVDAEQWFPDKNIVGVVNHGGYAIALTSRDIKYIHPGDWIVHSNGQILSYTNSVFEELYEPVVE